MAIQITQTNYDTSKQNIRKLSIKVNILNFQFQTVDEISGSVNSGSITIDANSDIRRTCDLSMVVSDSSIEISSGGKIWMDKFVQIFTGIESVRTGEIDWINQGIYMINNPSIQYDSITNVLTFQGLDLMAKLTGIRNGYIGTMPTTIPVGSNIRNAMISVLTQLGGFTRYIILENPQTVPYEIKIEVGATVYDLITQLRDISPSWETFFDVDGVFHYQPIPTGSGDPIMLDNDIWQNVLISDNTDVNFENVKNRIEVWGKSHEPNFYGGLATVNGNSYEITVGGLTTLEANTIIGFTAPSILTTPTLKINSLTPIALLNEDGTSAIIPEANIYYVVLAKSSTELLYLGRQQIYAVAQVDDPTSPYYVGGTVGTILLPLSGGEYANIVTDKLAMERAKYEIFLRTNNNDAVSLNCVPIFWLDVNIKMAYNKNFGGIQIEYIIKSVSTDLSPEGTQTVQAIYFNPLYPPFA
ncbi:MAG: hypothetical protein WCO84_01445 [bacterium]